jgi:hypothetical protein
VANINTAENIRRREIQIHTTSKTRGKNKPLAVRHNPTTKQSLFSTQILDEKFEIFVKGTRILQISLHL